MNKISKFTQYFVAILVLTITFVNFGTDFDNINKNKVSFPTQEIRNMTDEKLEEFLKNLQKQEKNSPVLFDKKRITKAATTATCTLFLEALVFSSLANKYLSLTQSITLLIFIPFSCYFATDYLFDKFYGKKAS